MQVYVESTEAEQNVRCPTIVYFYDTETMVLDYVIIAAFTFLCVGFIGNSITVGLLVCPNTFTLRHTSLLVA